MALMERLKELTIIATYTALGWTADMAEDLIGWVMADRRPDSDYKASVLDEWSDNEITGGNADDPLHGLVHIPEISSGVRLLAPHSVLKTEPITSGEPQSTEGTALQLVFDKTTIPVPRLRRTIDIMGFIHLNAMDFVEGKLLSEAWGTLNIMGKIRVAWALRSHLRQLRKYLQGNKDTAPGPPNPAPAVCHAPSIFGPMIADRGPFKNAQHLSSFLSRQYDLAMRVQKVPQDHPWHQERQIYTEPLVFSHMDLVPRNIILGKDGRVWIIDWAYSGYYPVWFEYVATKIQATQDRVHYGHDFKYWDLLIPFICGPYHAEYRWYSRLAGSFEYKIEP